MYLVFGAAVLLMLPVLFLYRPTETITDYKMIFQEREITGTYEGQTRNHLPDGEGTFTSDNGKFVYTGGFSKGEMSGKGFLKDAQFVQTYPGDLVDRVGTYEGEMLDGEASGQATFRTQNKAYDWYTYTGAYEHNRWNGYGRLKYDDEFYFLREGNFVDCEFMPTVEQFYKCYGTWLGMPYELTEETAALFREEGEAMLSDPEAYTKDAPEVTYEALKDHVGEVVHLMGLTIVENEHNDVLWGRHFMNICAEDEGGNRVHLLALAAYPVGWNYKIDAYVIPLAASVYPNEYAEKTDTFVCAVIEID